ncbi:bleomycin hydrolase-like protein [Ramicandelaber brevisporus]|nr:bleomycin hydrolase-like protein [Ramicandelaber brevisporus]
MRIIVDDETAGELSLRAYDKFYTNFKSQPRNLLAALAVSKGEITNILESRDVVIANPPVFNVKIPIESSKPTNQDRSGRCWIFAGCNMLRISVISKYNLDPSSFELSESFLFFYDKVEKANWFLENMINLLVNTNEEPESRLMSHLLSDPVDDGGQWAMFVSLVEKYGIVPKNIYPESYSSSNTNSIGHLVTTKLRDYARELYGMARERKLPVEALRVAKMRMMDEVYRMMVISSGVPPYATNDANSDTFDWVFYDKSGKFHEYRGLTPLAFYKDHVAIDMSKYLSLVHDPRNPYMRNYTVAYLGNVVGGPPVRYINVQLADIKQYCLKVLGLGRPVWFGCDISKQAAYTTGVMALKIWDYEAGFGLNKTDRLRYGESAMTHAMVITGVYVDESTGKPKRWRVENSWGGERGDNGYFTMADDWFDEYLFQVVMRVDDVPKEVADVLKQEVIVLPAWDPMSKLAR